MKMGKRKKPREYKAGTRVKLRSAKLVDRITFTPSKHKQKVRRKMRKDLQMKTVQPSRQSVPATSLRFGSFNVNGLDIEAAWAVEGLLKENEFDVTKSFDLRNFIYSSLRYLH